jgi:menaquinone-9 beta-reductase
VHTDRGELSAPLIVDALGWRRVLSRAEPGIQPPAARLSRGLEVHPHGSGADLELWLDPAYVRAGYSWSFPAGDELRVGVGSFDPRDHVKEPTVRLAGDLDLPAVRYQGNWIPHQMRRPVEDGVFFAGDSAGHCLPTTAEGIRTALYFGLACGRELRAVVESRQDRARALTRYAAFCDRHERAFRWLLRVQGLVSRVNPTPLMTPTLRAMDRQRFIDWSFGHYLRIAPPEFALAGGSAAEAGGPEPVAAAA